MTDKERLEEIKEKTSSIAEPMLYIDWYDTKWLIKQAERVQELEDIIYQDARQGMIEDLYEENKRYREAQEKLEQVYKENYVRYADCYEDGYLDGLETAMSIIDEALEGEGE